MRQNGRTVRVAYEGGPGAFAESAFELLFPGQVPIACRTPVEVFERLGGGDADAAVVALDSTFAGAIPETYEALRRHDEIAIVAELVLPVQHFLLGLATTRLGDIRVARSSPQSLQQVADFLALNGIQWAVAFDPSLAAAEVAAGGQTEVAAVASRRAAEVYGLQVLTPIQTKRAYFTRFIAVASGDAPQVADRIPAQLRAGVPKTSLLVGLDDSPGAVLACVQPLADAGLTVKKLQPWPDPDRPWSYDFFIDVEGDLAHHSVAGALTEVGRRSRWSRVLGVYRSATRVTSVEGSK